MFTRKQSTMMKCSKIFESRRSSRVLMSSATAFWLPTFETLEKKKKQSLENADTSWSRWDGKTTKKWRNWWFRLFDGKLFCARNIFKVIHIEWLGDSTPHTPLSNFLPRRTCILFLGNGLFIMILQSQIVQEKKTIEPKPENKKKSNKTFDDALRHFSSFDLFFRAQLRGLVYCSVYRNSQVQEISFKIFLWFLLLSRPGSFSLILFSVKYCLMFMRKLCEAISSRHRGYLVRLQK